MIVARVIPRSLNFQNSARVLLVKELHSVYGKLNFEISENEKGLVRNVHSVYGKVNLKPLKEESEICPVKVDYDVYSERLTEENKSAPPLIILDGLLGSKYNWVRYSKTCQRETNPPREIIPVETRNHGNSSSSEYHTYEHVVADIKYLLHERNLKKCALLGFSIGGRAAMLFSLIYPEMVEKLLIVDISPISISVQRRKTKELMEAMMRVQIPENVSLEEARTFANGKMKDAIKNDKLRYKYVSDFLVQNENGGCRWAFNLPSLHRNFEILCDFTPPQGCYFNGPTLFLAGGKSDFLPECDRPQIKQLFPNAEFRVVEGASHFVPFDKPEEFRQHSLAFLNGIV